MRHWTVGESMARMSEIAGIDLLGETTCASGMVCEHRDERTRQGCSMVYLDRERVCRPWLLFRAEEAH